jgi:hypothetical protein
LFRHDLQLKPAERVRLSGITLSQLTNVLERYLDPDEIKETHLRIQWVLEQSNLGFDAISKGRAGKDGFPSYSEWFKAHNVTGTKNKVVSKIEGMGKLLLPIA